MAGALAGLSRGLKIFLVVDLVLVVVLGVTAILVLGGGSSTDDSADTPQTPTTSSSAPADTATSAATSEGERRFASPTGNIACDLTGDGVTCTIANTSVETPAIEGCTGAGTGHVITLNADGVDTPCTDQVPGAAGPDVDVLQYGSSETVGDYTCTSGSNGMTCVDGGGVGFRIATAERALLP